LNPAEKRNAMSGNMRDFIAGLSEDHQVFPLTKLPNKRFEWADYASIAACIELADGSANVTAAALKSMYENNKTFDVSGKTAKKIERVLNFMKKVLADDTPEMDIKWGFVDLYFAISVLLGKYDLTGREAEIRSFYSGFESERRDVEDASLLISNSSSEWDRDMYAYIEAFIREGNKKGNIQTRHEIYIKRILHDISSLIPMDPQRAHSRNERIVIWRRDNGKCQEKSCGKNVEFDSMHADHIIPHSKGGKTTIDNGQTLCAACNLSKGASIS
jgi:hypothetical protein